MKIAPLAGAAWSADILTGQREFPVYKGKKDRGFKEVLDKAMEDKPMVINVYFYTDIRTIKPKDGTIYAALSAETPKGEVWIPHRDKVNANNAGASVKALHDIIAGDEHHIDPYKGSRIVIHSTSPYVTTSLFLLKRWKDDGWKTSKGADIAHKELWQEINCNLQGNSFEVIDEKDSEAIRELLEEKGAKNE